MLNTPFGNIFIFINKKEEPYSYSKLENKVYGQLGLPLFDVDGRYKISIDLSSQQIPKLIQCIFPEETLFDSSDIETGERLALKNWYFGNLKISIATEDEIDGINIEYLNRGIEIQIAEHFTGKEVIFGIAWMSLKNPEEEDIYTWFAADPTLSM